jgi:hypothetical protein
MVRDQARSVLTTQDNLGLSTCPAAENPVHSN